MTLTGFLGHYEPILAFTVGTQQILFVVFLAFLLFGANKIPELMRALGRAQGEFQKAKTDFEKEVKATKTTDAPPKAEPATEEAGAGADIEATRQRAEELGIETEGKDIATLKREIADKVIQGA